MRINLIDRSVDLPCSISEPLRNAVEPRGGVDSLAAHVKQVYADLQHSRDFRELLETARRFTPGKQSPVFHETLVEDHHCRLSLIGIHRFAPIPVHDHPRTTGVQLVLHGRVQVRNYRISEVVREPSLVRLECVAESVLGVGSTAAVEDRTNNLHGLQALNLNAVCLALQAPPLAAERQAWYFPTHPLADHHQHTTWNRILKPPRQSHPSHNRSAIFKPGGASPC